MNSENSQILKTSLKKLLAPGYRVRFIVGAVSLSLIIVGIKLVAYNAEPNKPVLAVALQSDQKILYAGQFSDSYIMRKDQKGLNDDAFTSSWGNIGGFNRPIRSIAVLSDDSTIVAGEFTSFHDSVVSYIAKINKDGTLNTEFAKNSGTGFDNIVNTVTLQLDGKILVGGEFTSYNSSSKNTPSIARLNPDGTLDESFKSGSGFDQPVLTVESLSDGSILVGGNFSTYNGTQSPYIAKLSATGEINSKFVVNYANQ